MRKYHVLGWGLLLKSVSKWSYVSVDNWLPSKEYIMPRRWLGRDEAFLGRMPGEKQLALSASELGLFLMLQTRTRGVMLKPKGTLLSFPSTDRVHLSLGDSKSVYSAPVESLFVVKLNPTASILLLGITNDVSFLLFFSTYVQVGVV